MSWLFFSVVFTVGIVSLLAVNFGPQLWSLGKSAISVIPKSDDSKPLPPGRHEVMDAYYVLESVCPEGRLDDLQDVGAEILVRLPR